jgi:hypothetical protein
MPNFNIATSTPVTAPVGTDEAYIIGKKRITLGDLKAFTNTGVVTTAQITTEQGRVTALETSQTAQDTAIADKADAAATTAALGLKADASALTALTTTVGLKADATALTAATGRITSLESRDLEIGPAIRTGTFNGVLGSIEPFSIAASNAVCVPPATGTLTDGVEFGVILHGTPGVGFNCTVDFQTAGQTLQGLTGANANVIITDEVTPFTVRWSAVHAQWFIVR